MKALSGILAIAQNLVLTRKIPALEPTQMLDLLQYMTKRASTQLRINVAEVAYRYHRDHASAFDLFLACVMPLAQRTAHRRAERFLFASEWQIETMYDGAVNLAIEMFQRAHPVGTADNAFRRYLLTTLKHGTSRAFVRQENFSTRTYANVERVRPFDNLRGTTTPRRIALNTVEDRMITRQLLAQVVGYTNLPGHLRAMLACIASLGPDLALKGHAYTASGDPDKWKRERGRRPILDPNAIAQAMGVTRRSVHVYLREARLVLREAFNADGKLFQRR